ncbi:Thioredoxin O, mitochondrial [Zea mays]|uniref:Thioredoxin O, mitochondrial n=1 Tax=Zea mays TaxID=4577 RepID=A0A3L6DB01_MAIZE|nr:Thioredoxin O, mitochondrial [Zea mays]
MAGHSSYCCCLELVWRAWGEEGLGNKLRDLNICSVPTFHFYHKGQRISEIVGADAKKIEATMESLHKQQ